MLTHPNLAADALTHKWDVAATTCVFVSAGAITVGGPTWASVDDVAAGVVGLMMVVAAGREFFSTSRELLDQMPPRTVIDRLHEIALSVEGVIALEKILGRLSGTRYFIDLHIEMPDDLTVREAHTLSHRVKDRLLASMPELEDVIVHIEPHREPEPEIENV